MVAPANWLFGFLVYSLITKNPKRKKVFFKLSLFMLFFFSNAIIYNEVRRLYEPKEILLEELGKVYDYGIVLTGMTYVNRETGSAHFSSGGDRLMQAVNLYGQGKIKKILITGGSSRIFDNEYREATYLRSFLLNLGLPQEDVIAEYEARNTYENAAFTANLLAEKEYENLLLITSSQHMPRSIACFKKTGLDFDIFPTDPIYARVDYGIKSVLLPNPSVLGAWASMFHEWIGYLSYWVMGYV